MLNYGVSIYMGTRIHAGSLPVLLAAGVICLLLEAYLARREKRWPGLLLPGVSFLWALAGAVLYVTAEFGRLSGAVGFGLLIFLDKNVVTLALLAVYAACREHRKRSRRRREAQMDKMNIDDL